MSVWKQLAKSVYDIKSYVEWTKQKAGKTTGYFFLMVLILTIIFSVKGIVEINKVINTLPSMIENNFPEFTFKDGALDVKSINHISIQMKMVKCL